VVKLSEESKDKEIKEPPPPQYFTFSLQNSSTTSIFVSAASSSLISKEEVYSKGSDWEKVIQRYPGTTSYEFCTELLKLPSRKWYTEYLSVTHY